MHDPDHFLPGEGRPAVRAEFLFGSSFLRPGNRDQIMGTVLRGCDSRLPVGRADPEEDRLPKIHPGGSIVLAGDVRDGAIYQPVADGALRRQGGIPGLAAAPEQPAERPGGEFRRDLRYRPDELVEVLRVPLYEELFLLLRGIRAGGGFHYWKQEISQPDPAGVERSNGHFPGLQRGHEEFPIHAAGGAAAVLRGVPVPIYNGGKRNPAGAEVPGKTAQPEDRAGADAGVRGEPVRDQPGHIVFIRGAGKIMGSWNAENIL